LFHYLGDTGGLSVKFLPLASTRAFFSFRFFKLKKNDLAKPVAVFMQARLNIAGMSHLRGNGGKGLSLVLWVNLSSSVNAFLLVSSRISSWFWIIPM
jgi:hypothetical protein